MCHNRFVSLFVNEYVVLFLVEFDLGIGERVVYVKLLGFRFKQKGIFGDLNNSWLMFIV